VRPPSPPPPPPLKPIEEDHTHITNLERFGEGAATNELTRQQTRAKDAQTQAGDEDPWAAELAALKRNAKQLSERDATRGALLFGAVSVLASTMQEFDAAQEALGAAKRLSRERWIATIRRRRAWQARDFDKALEAAREELDQVGEPRERVALLTEVAALEVVTNGNRAAALHALEEARELDPASATVIEALAELHIIGRNWEDLLQVVVALADATVDVQYRSMMRHNAGVIQDVRLNLRAAARASYKLALSDDPQNIAAALSLETLCLLDEDWTELARTLLTEATLIGDPQTVRRLCERAGDLLWEKLHDAESALTAYHQAAKAAPTESSPLRRLAAVLESTGRWRELIDIHEKELGVTHDPVARADLYFRIAETQRTKLGHLDAAEVAYAAALDVDPLHLPTLQSFDALFRSGARWAELAQMQLREAEKITDPKRRADHLVEVAELLERRLGDRHEAVRLNERAYELAPGHRLAFFALDRLYRRAEKWTDLVRLYEQQAPHTTDRALHRFLRQESARLWSERVPNSDRAAAAFADVWGIEERDLGPLFLMARVLEAAEKWEPLAGALDQQAKVLRDDVDRIAVKQRLAAVLELHLERPDDALAVHERVLELDSDNETSLRAMARLHHLAGRWREVIDIWTRQLAHCATERERAALHYHIGRVHERKLGERDNAVAAYARALADDALHASAMRALDRILRRDRQWKELCAALERRAGALTDPRQQAMVLHEIAQIEELHLRDLEGAQKRYQAVQQRHPQYETASVALIHVAEARGDFASAATELGRLIERTSHVEAKMALCGQLGLIYEHRLDQPERAAARYTQAIDGAKLGRVFALAELRATAAAQREADSLVAPLRRLGSRCTDIRLAHGYRALAALRDEVSTGAAGPELFLDAGRLEQIDPLVSSGIVRALGSIPEGDLAADGLSLPGALTAAADVCSNAPVKTLRLYEAALRLDRAGRPDAMATYEQAARYTPDFLPLLRGRRRLAVAGGDWTLAASLLAREAELAADRGDRIRALMTAAQITLDRLHDQKAALRHYRRLLELEPAHEEAFVRARALHEEHKDDAGLIELVVARAAATGNTRERAAMLKLQAELQRDRMKDPRSAVAALKQAIALAPDDLDAYLMLAPLEEEQRWWQGAADCYRKIAELTPGSDQSRTARLREAQIREDELGDREAARAILEELIIDDTDRQAARQMAQLCVRMGQRTRARELYLHAAETGSVTERIEDLLALAEVPVDNVTDEAGDRAVAEAFELATTQRDGVAALVKVYGERNDWNGFMCHAERACEGQRGDGVVALRLAMASVYADRMSRPDLAAAQLQAARQLAPNDAALTQRLAQLQLASGQGDRAVGEFRRALAGDPFNTAALRGLGEAVKPRLPELATMFGALADLGDGRVVVLQTPPRRSPLSGAELQLLGAANPLIALVAELVRQLEPYAPAMIADVMGLGPRGEMLPPNHPLAVRIATTAQTFGLPAFRVHHDPEAAAVFFAASGDGVVIVVGGRLANAAGPARVAFDAARLFSFVVEHQTLAAVTDANQLAAILASLAPSVRPELEKVKARLGRVLPRKARKELERMVSDPSVLNATPAYWADVQRRADRAALLTTGDPVTAMLALSGSADVNVVRRTARSHDLMTWLLSDDAWQVLAAFVRSTPHPSHPSHPQHAPHPPTPPRR